MKKRLVDGRASLDDGPVGGDLLARPDDEEVAPQRATASIGTRPLAAVGVESTDACFAPSSTSARSAAPAPALRARLEVPARQAGM